MHNREKCMDIQKTCEIDSEEGELASVRRIAELHEVCICRVCLERALVIQDERSCSTVSPALPQSARTYHLFFIRQ